MEVPLAQFVFVQWLVTFLSNEFFFFEWDEGNKFKSKDKHGILVTEAEEAFYPQSFLKIDLEL